MMKRVRIRYGDWVLKADLYEGDGKLYMEANGFEEEDVVWFTGRSRKELHEQMQKWFRDQVENHQISELIRRGYRIAYKGKKMLADVRESRIAYHISPQENRQSILEKGLLPNSPMVSSDVYHASALLDSIKPKWIPDWVQRVNALYLYPEMPIDHLLMLGYPPPSDLYAVKLPNTKGWMGSQLYGGFCISDGPITDEERLRFIKEDVGKKYWSYSCSLEDYIKYDRRTRKKDRYVQGYDEILFFESIPPENIEWIGSWDETGFTPTDAFMKYVKEECKQACMKLFGIG